MQIRCSVICIFSFGELANRRLMDYASNVNKKITWQMMIIKVIYLNLKYSNTQLNILFTLCIIMLSTFLRLSVLYITTTAFLGMHYIVFNVQFKPCSLKIKKQKLRFFHLHLICCCNQTASAFGWYIIYCNYSQNHWPE